VRGENRTDRRRSKIKKFTAAQLHRGMRVCKQSFVHEGKLFEAGKSWWHSDIIPPELDRYFVRSGDLGAVLEAINRGGDGRGVYGVGRTVPPRDESRPSWYIP
jgi:hypothetical protein